MSPTVALLLRLAALYSNTNTRTRPARAGVGTGNEGRIRAPHLTVIEPPPLSVSPPHLAAPPSATQQRTAPLAAQSPHLLADPALPMHVGIIPSATQQRTAQLRTPPIAPSASCDVPDGVPMLMCPQVIFEYEHASGPAEAPGKPMRMGPADASAVTGNEGRVRPAHLTAIEPPPQPLHSPFYSPSTSSSAEDASSQAPFANLPVPARVAFLIRLEASTNMPTRPTSRSADRPMFIWTHKGHTYYKHESRPAELPGTLTRTALDAGPALPAVATRSEAHGTT
ncbi:hypothetical protein JB92DRAFT_2825656 [Gautieria morchelliformis]|nr:hypothetical protein JB92DRAFT_2825656 [Gautieria morchelliformis]